MKTEAEIRAHLLQKAEADSDFRARLLSNTRETVQQELDISVPEAFSLQVHEETATSFHLVLPPAGDRLSTDELAVVAGANPGSTGHGHDGENWGPGAS